MSNSSVSRPGVSLGGRGAQWLRDVHSAVGGDMETGSSPSDPLFWLHHANIDRLWAKWQKQHPGVKPVLRQNLVRIAQAAPRSSHSPRLRALRRWAAGYRHPQTMDLARSHGPTGFGVEDGRRKGSSRG